MRYLVIVTTQGITVAEHTVQATDALAAINQVEPQYGESVQITYVSVELDNGRKQHKMVVNDWHGYSFLARPLPPEQ